MSYPAYDSTAEGRPSDAEIAELPYRLGVGVLLLNRANRVFVAQRLDMKTEAWQMPQGGIDPGEDPLQAAFRELKEEIGTNRAQALRETEWIAYDLPRELIPKLWKGRYRGQKQKWYAMRFLGSDEEIDIDGPEPEFSAWRWAEFEHLPELIVPFKRNLYRRLVDEFRPLLGTAPPAAGR